MAFEGHPRPGLILSVQHNQLVQSKTQIVQTTLDEKKSGELSSTNTGVQLSHFDRAKVNFVVLSYDQGLLTHTQTGTGVPRQFLTDKILKLAHNSTHELQ